MKKAKQATIKKEATPVVELQEEKFTATELTDLHTLISRTSVQGNEVEGVVYLKQKIARMFQVEKAKAEEANKEVFDKVQTEKKTT